VRAESFQSNIDKNKRKFNKFRPLKEHLATTENHQKKLEAATEKHQRKMEKYAKIDTRVQAAELGLTFGQTVHQLVMSHVMGSNISPYFSAT
jgi:exonuclease VII small subunit